MNNDSVFSENNNNGNLISSKQDDSNNNEFLSLDRLINNVNNNKAVDNLDTFIKQHNIQVKFEKNISNNLFVFTSAFEKKNISLEIQKYILDTLKNNKINTMYISPVNKNGFVIKMNNNYFYYTKDKEGKGCYYKLVQDNKSNGEISFKSIYQLKYDEDDPTDNKCKWQSIDDEKDICMCEALKTQINKFNPGDYDNDLDSGLYSSFIYDICLQHKKVETDFIDNNNNNNNNSESNDDDQNIHSTPATRSALAGRLIFGAGVVSSAVCLSIGGFSIVSSIIVGETAFSTILSTLGIATGVGIFFVVGGAIIWGFSEIAKYRQSYGCKITNNYYQKAKSVGRKIIGAVCDFFTPARYNIDELKEAKERNLNSNRILEKLNSNTEELKNKYETSTKETKESFYVVCNDEELEQLKEYFINNTSYDNIIYPNIIYPNCLCKNNAVLFGLNEMKKFLDIHKNELDPIVKNDEELIEIDYCNHFSQLDPIVNNSYNYNKDKDKDNKVYPFFIVYKDPVSERLQVIMINNYCNQSKLKEKITTDNGFKFYNLSSNIEQPQVLSHTNQFKQKELNNQLLEGDDKAQIYKFDCSLTKEQFQDKLSKQVEQNKSISKQP